MNDAAIRQLAQRAGITEQWLDYANKPRRVSLDTIRRILTALGLPCATADDVAHSRRLLDSARPPPLITASVGQPIALPIPVADDKARFHLIDENGTATEIAARRSGRGLCLSGVQSPGYYTIELGQTRVTVAVAPARCHTIDDSAPGERVAGLAAQTYGLRSDGDCGIGDMAAVTALAKAAAAVKIDALALSPAHALFAADPRHSSPYSPSNRLFYNPLLADPSAVFGTDRVARARTTAGLGTAVREREASPLIDWTLSSNAKMSVLRCLFDDFAATDLAASPPTKLAEDFVRFCAARGAALEQHALFETLHAAQLQADNQKWNWRDWPPEWRDPSSTPIQSFREKNRREILSHSFLQWIADVSFAAAQRQAKRAGMRIGLISDLAIGMNGGGSQAWMSQAETLGGLEIGAPPDLFNINGQTWGLTTFSPRALSDHGFAPFIVTLRACMRYSGGVRIDHAMGFMRLWVTPLGAPASEGAYLTYPLDDLLRLTALESYRHRSIVIGEDLGTVPAGFRDRLARTGIYGMSILWFERDAARFTAPPSWSPNAVAMTSTHDLPPVAAWWRGSDLELRAKYGMFRDEKAERAARRKDRISLWSAFSAANPLAGDLPAPNETSRVVDEAVSFIAATPSPLALLPLEDALGQETQPNVPGTIDEHPNWKSRYAGDAGALLAPRDVGRRVETLAKRGAS
jgi:4-alpha-glucanotransferase